MDELMSPLVQTLTKELTMVVRSAPSSGDYLEAVLSREDLQRCYALLSTVFGPPAKAFDAVTTFDSELRKLVDQLGGIRRDQCLFLKQRSDRSVAYATLWPWASDATRITLKVGLVQP